MRESVVFIARGLSGGGAEVQLLLIARGLALRGIGSMIITVGSCGTKGRYDELLSSCVRAGVKLYVADRAFALLRIYEEVQHRAERGRCIVWSWGFSAELIRIMLWSNLRGVFAIRSASVTQMQRRRWLLYLGRSVTWRYISNSRFAVQIAERIMSGVSSKSCVVYNAVDPRVMEDSAMLGSRPRVLDVVMLGNIRYVVKGYDLLSSLVEFARRSRLPMRIRIGGAQYPGEPNMQAEIVRAGMGDVVEWVGQVGEPIPFLKSAHVFLLLSRYEGMPNALFEAMGLGLPCIATEVGDLRAFAAESDGFKVIPVGDAAAAFEQLFWVWQNWEEAVAMGNRAQNFCRKYFVEERMISDVVTALRLGEMRAREGII